MANRRSEADCRPSASGQHARAGDGLRLLDGARSDHTPYSARWPMPGGQEVPGSNPGSPTSREFNFLRMAKPSTSVGTGFVDTMSDFLARTLRAGGRSENTIFSYCSSVRVLKEFLDVRGRPLAVDVSRDDIRGFISEQSTPRTIADSQGRTHKAGSAAMALIRLKSLKALFKRCVNEDKLANDPIQGMKPPKVQAEPVPIVSDDVLAKLAVRKGTTQLRDTTLLRVLFDSGAF
jgi:hypothetical protein